VLERHSTHKRRTFFLGGLLKVFGRSGFCRGPYIDTFEEGFPDFAGAFLPIFLTIKAFIHIQSLPSWLAFL